MIITLLPRLDYLATNLFLAEIRNLIYEYALTTKNGIIDIKRTQNKVTRSITEPTRVVHDSNYKKKFKDLALGLLRANKQTHKEASLYLWTHNTLRFASTVDLASFLGRHLLHVRYITRIVVDGTMSFHYGASMRAPGEMAFSLLGFAENLETIKLCLDLPDSPESGKVRQFYDLTRNSLHAIGVRKGNKLAAMDLLVINGVFPWSPEDQTTLSARHQQLITVFREGVEQLILD